MAAHHGNEGSVASGANSIAEVQSWSYEDSDPFLADKSAMGDTEVTHLASGMTQGSGSVSCFWDETDTNGQATLTVGSTVTLNLYPEGETSGDTYYTGDVVIESVNKAGAKGDIVTADFAFRGVLTEATVS